MPKRPSNEWFSIITTTMCSIFGSMSVPSGSVGFGRDPGLRTTAPSRSSAASAPSCRASWCSAWRRGLRRRRAARDLGDRDTGARDRDALQQRSAADREARFRRVRIGESAGAWSTCMAPVYRARRGCARQISSGRGSPCPRRIRRRSRGNPRLPRGRTPELFDLLAELAGQLVHVREPDRRRVVAVEARVRRPSATSRKLSTAASCNLDEPLFISWMVAASTAAIAPPTKLTAS